MTVPADPRKLADTVREALEGAWRALGRTHSPLADVVEARAALDALESLAEQLQQERDETVETAEGIDRDIRREREARESAERELGIERGSRIAAERELDEFRHNTWHCTLEDRDAMLVERDTLWKRVESAERERDMARASGDDWERQAKGRGVVQYELLARAESAEAALRAAQARADELEKALVLVRDWVREGKGTESDAAEAMDAVLAASPQAGEHAERKAAAEQELCRAADAYVWNPTDETMEALRNARAEWQTAVGRWKLATRQAGEHQTQETT